MIFLFGTDKLRTRLHRRGNPRIIPDREAKRCIDRERNRRHQVWIEFEIQSATFREHGHNPKECGLIVCWEHNWSECSLEVVELRSLIDQLER